MKRAAIVIQAWVRGHLARMYDFEQSLKFETYALISVFLDTSEFIGQILQMMSHTCSIDLLTD